MKKTLFTILLAGLALALPTASFGQVAPPLGDASSFVLFTAVGAFDNVGPTVVSGDIGTNAGQFSGFPLGVQLTGVTHVADTYSTSAATAVQLAFDYLSGVPCVQPLAVLGGPPSNPQVLLPNNYCVNQATTLAGNLILDGQNNSNATFFIRVGGALTTGELSTVTLINGASANHVYWQVIGRVDLGQNSVMRGTLVVDGAINMIEGASLIGRGLSRQGAITLDTNTASQVEPTEVVWNGSLNTDWYTAGNWTPATVPTSSLNATIPAGVLNMPTIGANTATTANLSLQANATLNMTGGTLDLRGNLTSNGTFVPTGGTVVLGATTTSTILGGSRVRFWNLTVNASTAQVGTTAGAAVRRLLTLNGNLATLGRPLVLESSATGTGMVYNNGGVISGNATFQRFISPTANSGLGYRHVSAPVSNATVASLATAGFSPVVNPAYNAAAQPGTVTPFPSVYGYDQSRLNLTNDLDFFSKGWLSPTTTTDALTVAKGYSVNLTAGQTLSFTGTPNDGTYSQPLARGPVRLTAGVDQSGWQLVGNPYPSPLDYSQVSSADRVNLDAAIYIFSSSSQYQGTYRSYVNGVGGDPVLAVGQGFFARVLAGQTSGSLTFRNSQRLTTYTSPAYLRSTTTARPLVQLDLQGANAADPLYVYFEQGATAGTDSEFDAVKLPNTNGLNLSAVAGGDEMSISGLPLPGTSPVTVPLQVRVPATGSYTLHAAAIVNLPAGMVAYLRDRQTGAVQDLSQQPDYPFQLNAAYTGVRFELVFTSQTALATAPASLSVQVAVFPNPASQQVMVELPAALSRAATTATLLDALGRPVRRFVLPAGTASHALPLTNVAAGLYSLRVNTDQGTITKKLLIN